MVLPTSCDQMRRGAEWLGDPARVFLFDLPSKPCGALLKSERARLKRWARGLPASAGRVPREVCAEEPPRVSFTFSIGIIGGHFCGDVAGVRRFFEARGVGIDLWGCEGGEHVGDIFQRPNGAFHESLARVVRERGLAGLVVVRTTWCDVWRAVFARVRETAPVPVTEWVLDGLCEGQPFPDARSETRLEAFCETVARRRHER